MLVFFLFTADYFRRRLSYMAKREIMFALVFSSLGPSKIISSDWHVCVKDVDQRAVGSNDWTLFHVNVARKLQCGFTGMRTYAHDYRRSYRMVTVLATFIVFSFLFFHFTKSKSISLEFTEFFLKTKRSERLIERFWIVLYCSKLIVLFFTYTYTFLTCYNSPSERKIFCVKLNLSLTNGNLNFFFFFVLVKYLEHKTFLFLFKQYNGTYLFCASSIDNGWYIVDIKHLIT